MVFVGVLFRPSVVRADDPAPPVAPPPAHAADDPADVAGATVATPAPTSCVIGAVPELEDVPSSPPVAAAADVVAADVVAADIAFDVADAANAAASHARIPLALRAEPLVEPSAKDRRFLAAGLAGVSSVGGAVVGATCAAPFAAVGGPLALGCGGLIGCCAGGALGGLAYTSPSDALVVGAGGAGAGLAGLLVGASGGALVGVGTAILCGRSCSGGNVLVLGATVGGAALGIAGGMLGAVVTGAHFARSEPGSYVAVSADDD